MDSAQPSISVFNVCSDYCAVLLNLNQSIGLADARWLVASTMCNQTSCLVLKHLNVLFMLSGI